MSANLKDNNHLENQRIQERNAEKVFALNV